jgi:hypothetical protein
MQEEFLSKNSPSLQKIPRYLLGIFTVYLYGIIGASGATIVSAIMVSSGIVSITGIGSVDILSTVSDDTSGVGSIAHVVVISVDPVFVSVVGTTYTDDDELDELWTPRLWRSSLSSSSVIQVSPIQSFSVVISSVRRDRT